MAFFFAILVIGFIALVVTLIVRSQAVRGPRLASPPRAMIGMDPRQSARMIYGNMSQQGLFQPGRAYSTAYLGQMAGVPYIPDPDERWMYWSMVFSELNVMLDAGGYGYYGSPYQYGGDYAFCFGTPEYYYGSPGIEPILFDIAAGSLIDLAVDASYANSQPTFYDQGPVDTGFDLGAVADVSAGVDAGGIFDSGSDFGSSDFSGGSDFGGFDS